VFIGYILSFIVAVLLKTAILNAYHGFTTRAKGTYIMTLSISFAKQEKKGADTIAVGIFEKGKLSKAAQFLNDSQRNCIKKCLKNHPNFKGKNGDMLSLAHCGDNHGHIVLFGLGKSAGKKSDLNTTSFENIGGKLFDALKKSGSQSVNIQLDGIEGDKNTTAADIASHLALGLKLKSYNFDKYKTIKSDDKPTQLGKVNIVTAAHSKAKTLFKTQDAVSEGVFFARNLVNEPPNELHPESYAKLIEKELKPLGVEVEILDEKKMTKMGFKALLSVGQGSIRESRAVIMRWNGAKTKIKKNAKNPIAFVGKGVTFDTGGISLKPGAGMDLMKMDMGGSAAVVGLMKAIAGRKAKANVIGIVGLVENMPSDRAYRPGDIIGSLSGKTIEVLNTDAEGRLVLADALTYVQDTYKPEVVIDLATLTGAIMVALGAEYCGTFVNDDKLWDQLKSASENTGEKFWRMPLDAAYRKEVESEVADLKNLGNSSYGGACTAAGFLEHFVEDSTKWAHIDIAGTAWWNSEKATTPKGGTGFPVRALNDLIAQHYEKK
jgi:leucyl aminopeptidase